MKENRLPFQRGVIIVYDNFRFDVVDRPYDIPRYRSPRRIAAVPVSDAAIDTDTFIDRQV